MERLRDQTRGPIRKHTENLGTNFWVTGEALGAWNSGSDWGESESQCAGPGPDGLLGKMVTSFSWPGATRQLTSLPFLIVQGQVGNEGLLRALSQAALRLGGVSPPKNKRTRDLPQGYQSRDNTTEHHRQFCAEECPWKFQNLCDFPQ